MVYVVSDLHGNYEAFIKLLELIDFDCNRDHMIILGDVFDRGKSAIKLLTFIQKNIKNGSMEMILGNHELFGLMFLRHQLDAETWSLFGGENTLEDILNMSISQKSQLKEFLAGLPLYVEITSKFGKTICTHTGLHAKHLVYNFDGFINVKESIKEGYEKAPFEFLCGADLHNMEDAVLDFLDSFLIVGHVPCFRFPDYFEGHFVRRNQYIVIDGGCGYDGGHIGCYNVDTDEEFFVE